MTSSFYGCSHAMSDIKIFTNGVKSEAQPMKFCMDVMWSKIYYVLDGQLALMTLEANRVEAGRVIGE